jgi:hypothetical protein
LNNAALENIQCSTQDAKPGRAHGACSIFSQSSERQRREDGWTEGESALERAREEEEEEEVWDREKEVSPS